MTAVRPVEWEAAELASQALAADLRNALGSIMTVFRPRAQAVERRLESVLKDGRDPGPDSGGDDRSGAWVFQANPERFDLLRALRAEGLLRRGGPDAERGKDGGGEKHFYGVHETA